MTVRAISHAVLPQFYKRVKVHEALLVLLRDGQCCFNQNNNIDKKSYPALISFVKTFTF